MACLKRILITAIDHPAVPFRALFWFVSPSVSLFVAVVGTSTNARKQCRRRHDFKLLNIRFELI